MIRSASIRAKLMLITMATTFVSLTLLGGAWGLFEFISYRRAMTAEMETIGNIIGANSTAALMFNDEAGAVEVLSALEPQSEVHLGCIYDASARLFASFSRRGQDKLCPPAPPADGVGFDQGMFRQSNAILLGRERVGTLYLVTSLSKLWARLQLSALVLVLALSLSLLVAFLLSSRLQRLVSRPILELATTAKRISELQDYGLRAPQHTSDEVGVAVGAFNHMLERIQDADRALRKAGELSREQAQFLGSILDNMGEGMVVVDLQGEILVWNAAARRMVGPGPVGTKLQHWPRHFGLLREDAQTPLEPFDLPLLRALRGDVITDQELYVGAPPDGNARWVNASARPLRDEQGKPVGAVSVFRDVTLQKQAQLELKASEEQLRQAQKMDAVGQLAGGIAHDFNNLLTAICGYSSFALDLLSPDDPARENVEEVLMAGERAATLTRQLLAFSRKQVLAPRPLDLNRALQASEQMLRRLIGENIELSAAYEASRAEVLADPGQIDQVVLNLVVNARDAMPRGGQLTMRTSDVELDEQRAREHGGLRPGAYVKLSVRDTGVGMSEPVQARIFEPFFTTKPVGKGTGLGLSTVYGILKQSGGQIEVSSTPGAGTTFDVYLPCTHERALPQGSTSSDVLPRSRGKETILLAEDEEPVRNLARLILTRLGYEVLVGCDGVDALSVQARHDGPIHLLLSDVVMPRMGGGELAQRLRERLPQVRVLFFSGYTADATLHPSLPPGELVIISKPFTAEVLARKVREVLDREPLT